ncbi:MAG: hypothetical protein CMH57_15265 [Myxococcales bacterium]|nr:hypothetical protein [Myxococcales bacterium]
MRGLWSSSWSAALLVGAVALVVGCGDSGSGGDGGGADAGEDTGATSSSMDTGVEDSGQADTATPEDTGEGGDTDEADVEPDAAPVTMIEQPPAQGALQAGVGVQIVDGPVGISMAGFGGRSGGAISNWSDYLKASQGFYGRMTAKAMVLDVDGERLALVKLPTMCSEHSLTDGITAKLKERYDIDMEGRILTGATHSHHAQARYWRLPESLGLVGADSPDEEAIDRFSGLFAEAIKAAIDDLGPAEWGFAFKDDWDPDNLIYRDRRGENNPEYGKDPRLSLLAVRRPDGTPMATIINFGIHGTVFEGENDLLTEDSVGGVEMKFEEHFFAEEGAPIVGMFVQAGGGDASPAGDALNHKEPARIEKLGEDAAPMIMALYRTLEWSGELTLAVRTRRIDLRYDSIGYDESDEFLNAQGEPYLWGGWQCTSVQRDGPLRGAPKNCLPIDSLLESLGESIPNGEVHQTLLSVARLDDLVLVTLPGEPAYSIVRYLREEVAKRATEDQPLESMTFGYSQDHLLYLTHPDDWFEGGYESTMSLWGPLAGQHLVDRQMELMEQMLDGFNGPSFYEESPSLSTAKPFEPRALERSLEAGTMLQDPGGETYPRTSVVRMSVAAGDPNLGSPMFVVQVESGEGAFEDVPDPSGHPGAVVDNSRYQMIPLYPPDPPMSREIVAERHHDWTAQWQIPEDWPAGTYRLRAYGPYWDGTAEQTWELTSESFEVVQAEGAELAVEAAEGALALRLTLPPAEYAEAEGESWPAAGWRLLDRAVEPTARPVVRAPLLAVLVNGGGQPLGEPQTLLWDAAAEAHLFELSDAAPSGASVQVRLADDRTPSPITGALP